MVADVAAAASPHGSISLGGCFRCELPHPPEGALAAPVLLVQASPPIPSCSYQDLPGGWNCLQAGTQAETRFSI